MYSLRGSVMMALSKIYMFDVPSSTLLHYVLVFPLHLGMLSYGGLQYSF